jgi:DNA-binding CsgD family transcriptional regulator
VTAERCKALLAVASSDQALQRLSDAAKAYADMGLRFDAGRSLLSLGRYARRQKKWGIARQGFEGAAAVFAEIGSPGWARYAWSELARVGARKPKKKGTLTPTEERVARLAADGLSNKEIAANLFVTVHTVETHLSHVYAKLGIRSRGQLPRRLASPGRASKSLQVSRIGTESAWP